MRNLTLSGTPAPSSTHLKKVSSSLYEDAVKERLSEFPSSPSWYFPPLPHFSAMTSNSPLLSGMKIETATTNSKAAYTASPILSAFPDDRFPGWLAGIGGGGGAGGGAVMNTTSRGVGASCIRAARHEGDAGSSTSTAIQANGRTAYLAICRTQSPRRYEKPAPAWDSAPKSRSGQASRPNNPVPVCR